MPEVFNMEGNGWSPFDNQELSNPTSKKDQPTTKEFKELSKEISKAEGKSAETAKKEQELILKLTQYGQSQRFKAYLQSLSFNLSPSALKKLSLNDLEELLEKVKVSINQKSHSTFFSSAFFAGTGIVEKVVSSKVPKQTFDLTGFTEVLKQDEELADILEQLELEHGNLISLTPEKRLLLIVASSAIKVNIMNGAMNRMKMALEQRASSEGLRAQSLPTQPTQPTPNVEQPVPNPVPETGAERQQSEEKKEDNDADKPINARVVKFE